MFLAPSSPHFKSETSVAGIMRLVLLALIPGIMVSTYQFGSGVILNILLASIAAVGLEAGMLILRKRPLRPYLTDNSALLTAFLLALALPPLAPWWITFLGVFFAIVVAKQLYGGLGYNPFNPAMVGYAILLISFPAEMTTHWITPGSLIDMVGDQQMTLWQQINYQWFGNLPPQMQLDAFTSATPLDVVKTSLANGSSTITEIQTTGLAFGSLGGIGIEWVNLAYLAGGIWLITRRVISWHIPVSIIVSLGFVSLLFGSFELDNNPSPMFHYFSGATMLGAFFIATDPVTAAASHRGQLLFGTGIGVLIYTIRTWGGYPDAIAFAVLIMNMTVPLLDLKITPRVYGHKSRETDHKDH